MKKGEKRNIVWMADSFSKLSKADKEVLIKCYEDATECMPSAVQASDYFDKIPDSIKYDALALGFGHTYVKAAITDWLWKSYVDPILRSSKHKPSKFIAKCCCPPPKTEDTPTGCPDYNAWPQFSAVRFYGLSKAATDNIGNYLGQWEYDKETSSIKIVKQPYVVLLALDTKTGEAEFMDNSDNPNAMLVTHTEPIVSYCEIPEESRKEAMVYFNS